MEAVAAVIMNRVRDRRWPSNPTDVALQRLQFSAWNLNDPNRGLMQRVTGRDPQFYMALQIAGNAYDGFLKDPTGSANHFHSHRVNPVWSRGKQPTAIIGNHRFFRL
jgi:spore germination cell wall hydrolase CwlJ-like protein